MPLGDNIIRINTHLWSSIVSPIVHSRLKWQFCVALCLIQECLDISHIGMPTYLSSRYAYLSLIQVCLPISRYAYLCLIKVCLAMSHLGMLSSVSSRYAYLSLLQICLPMSHQGMPSYVSLRHKQVNNLLRLTYQTKNCWDMSIWTSSSLYEPQHDLIAMT